MVKMVVRKTDLKYASDEVIAFYKRHGHTVKSIRTDAGSVEKSKDLKNWADLRKVNLLPASIEHQEQNFVERDVQTIVKRVAAMLIDQDVVTAKYWSYALNSFIEAWNVTIKPVSNYNISPLEVVTGVVPNIGETFRYIFGAPVAILLLNVNMVMLWEHLV
jgi:hypothetical protein